MNKPLLDKLMDAKEENDVAYVCFFNDGKVRKDKKYFAHRMDEINNEEEFQAIEDVIYEGTKSYSRNFKFDSLDTELLLGLIFKAEDIDENNQIKEDAKPVEGIVRYYTGSLTCYLKNTKTNIADFGEYGMSRQGFVEFDKLMEYIKSTGLNYKGPETFNEFEEGILLGEEFEISLTANFLQERKEYKEEQEEIVQPKKHKLFKR